MSDIVERLQVHAEIMARDKGKWVRFIDAADCAEAAATITELRAALAKIDKQVSHAYMGDVSIALKAIRDLARAMLKGKIALEALKVEATK